MNASIPTLAWRIPSVKTQKAATIAFAKLDLKKARPANASVSIPLCSLRASSSVWASEASLARTRERGAFTRGACLALPARFVLRSLEKTREKNNRPVASFLRSRWGGGGGALRPLVGPPPPPPPPPRAPVCGPALRRYVVRRYVVSTSFPRSVKRVETWKRVQ